MLVGRVVYFGLVGRPPTDRLLDGIRDGTDHTGWGNSNPHFNLLLEECSRPESLLVFV